MRRAFASNAAGPCRARAAPRRGGAGRGGGSASPSSLASRHVGASVRLARGRPARHGRPAPRRAGRLGTALPGGHRAGLGRLGSARRPARPRGRQDPGRRRRRRRPRLRGRGAGGLAADPGGPLSRRLRGRRAPAHLVRRQGEPGDRDRDAARGGRRRGPRAALPPGVAPAAAEPPGFLLSRLEPSFGRAQPLREPRPDRGLHAHGPEDRPEQRRRLLPARLPVCAQQSPRQGARAPQERGRAQPEIGPLPLGARRRATSLQGQQEEALTEFLQSTVIDETFTEGFIALAALHRRLGDPEASQAAIERAAKAKPGDPLVLTRARGERVPRQGPGRRARALRGGESRRSRGRSRPRSTSRCSGGRKATSRVRARNSSARSPWSRRTPRRS